MSERLLSHEMPVIVRCKGRVQGGGSREYRHPFPQSNLYLSFSLIKEQKERKKRKSGDHFRQKILPILKFPRPELSSCGFSQVSSRYQEQVSVWTSPFIDPWVRPCLQKTKMKVSIVLKLSLTKDTHLSKVLDHWCSRF